MRKVAASVLLFLLSVPAFPESGLKLDAAIMAVGQGADIGSTYWTLHRCPNCREVGLLGNPHRVATGKVVLVAGVVVLCHELRKSGHKREARWVAIGVALAGGALAVHNMRQGR